MLAVVGHSVEVIENVSKQWMLLDLMNSSFLDIVGPKHCSKLSVGIDVSRYRYSWLEGMGF